MATLCWQWITCVQSGGSFFLVTLGCTLLTVLEPKSKALVHTLGTDGFAHTLCPFSLTRKKKRKLRASVLEHFYFPNLKIPVAFYKLDLKTSGWSFCSLRVFDFLLASLGLSNIP